MKPSIPIQWTERQKPLHPVFERHLGEHWASLPQPSIFIRIAAYTLDGLFFELLSQTLTLLLSLLGLTLLPSLLENSFFSSLIFIVLRAFCTTDFKGSPGKRILGLLNINKTSGTRLSFGKALVREFLTILSIVTVIPVLMSLVAPSRKYVLWQDELLDAVVVDPRKLEP